MIRYRSSFPHPNGGVTSRKWELRDGPIVNVVFEMTVPAHGEYKKVRLSHARRYANGVMKRQVHPGIEPEGLLVFSFCGY